ncbi:hypothetical protein P152DRAFT_462461 [Eremomyces bilateralis CBS 781.70]|uniref:Transcription initiation factor TFIID subunit 1 histone acetyltransferase domain-containing protein n=1 Tax=Eremomyces bilateralis CBS 781.70 TaxID=1392243 RepID=A0A6G1FRR3_9PEZI|nr:uncharacterized protein P152DRAFT_462461 [Eremomyces bilateralis CBS 781.70]KAF1808467.1 hypothetical protein P152DRAFT_462461 [Eremomyces bilateralis CBS 781.70]
MDANEREPDRGAADNDQDFERVLADLNNPDGGAYEFMSRDLEAGEKADDAVDFEDISDGSLADEEEQPRQADLDNDLDDLFNDAPTSPADENITTGATGTVQLGSDSVEGAPDGGVPSFISDADLFGEEPIEPEEHETPIVETTESTETLDAPQFRPIDFSGARAASVDDLDDVDDAVREQYELFRDAQDRMKRATSGTRLIDRVGETLTDNEALELLWPNFDPDEVPRFATLIPQKRAFYPQKVPPKPPKAVHPSKLSLELAADSERLFKLPGPAKETNPERRREYAEIMGLHLVEDEIIEEESEDGLDYEDIDWNEDVGGVKMRDLAVVCQDWDLPSLAGSDQETPPEAPFEESFEDELWGDATEQPPAKKRRLDDIAIGGSMAAFVDEYLPFDDPEELTAQLAQKVFLAGDDPNLLLDQRKPDAAKKGTASTSFRMSQRPPHQSRREWITSRYFISNDAAYVRLKENRSHKVRSNLGNLSVEHGLPALKLQYPFYKVKLTARESRSFHRHPMHFIPNSIIRFSKLASVKRKNMRNKPASTVFEKAKDLTFGDNSNMVLLEYSEEYPTMLSNLGMGNRILNYYRKKDNDDTNRPKLDIGETIVLLPEDKSPFSIFGGVNPGEQVPTIHNQMFRAPVFRHEAKGTDFLVGVSRTGVGGDEWFMRPVENLYVVGQQFPSVEVPGTHSRKVTDAAKRRLRMISYRIFGKTAKDDLRNNQLNNEVVRQHLPGSDITQNRGKMREFMHYNKELQTWEPKGDTALPDEQTMRGWIKPEDVCLLDSMQVGHRHLLDSGYNKEGNDEYEEDDEKEGQSLEERLAPWNTTKNFLNACQGKAMLALYGEGDPSGRGEAFSFVRTSMKGGFKAIGESVEDKLNAKRMKDLGGHSYNVAQQQKAYEEAIRGIWAKQNSSLSSTVEHDEVEMDIDEEPDTAIPGRTPRSEVATPRHSSFFRRDDDSVSQFSKFSTGSQSGKVLRIVRDTRDRHGNKQTEEEVITDEKVIREYMKRRKAEELSQLKLGDLRPTGDADFDAKQKKMLQLELERLQKNIERRHVREKAKGVRVTDGSTPGTPGSPLAAPAKNVGTQRKCANCGQIGHIKTNKKLCPLLNGKQKQEDGFDNAAFAQAQSGFGMGMSGSPS